VKDLGSIIIVESEENVFKYPMMHRLFNEPPVDTDWTIWFDDDSHATAGEWFERGIAHAAESGADCFGKEFFFHPGPGFRQWLEEASAATVIK